MEDQDFSLKPCSHIFKQNFFNIANVVCVQINIIFLKIFMIDMQGTSSVAFTFHVLSPIICCERMISTSHRCTDEPQAFSSNPMGMVVKKLSGSLKFLAHYARYLAHPLF